MWLFAFLLIVPQLRYYGLNKNAGAEDKKYKELIVAIIGGSELGMPNGWSNLWFSYSSSGWDEGSGFTNDDKVIQKMIVSELTDSFSATELSCELPIKELAASKPNSVLYLQNRKTQEKFYIDNTGTNPTFYTNDLTSYDSYIYIFGGDYDEHHMYYWIFTIGVEEKAKSITYLDQGSNDTFSGTLATGSPTTYVEGEGAELKKPTREGYEFCGWYDNINCTGDPVTEISTEATGDKTFYAKWKINTITVTLNNMTSCEGYMIYVYKGDIIYKQVYVTTATYSFDLEWVSDYNNTYRLAFVFGYYGNLTFDAKDATNGINTNITTANRSATITSFVNTTIKFTLANPRINSTIII